MTFSYMYGVIYFNLLFNLFMCMYVYLLIYVCQVHAGTHGSQKRAPEFPGLEHVLTDVEPFLKPTSFVLIHCLPLWALSYAVLSHRVGLGDGIQVLGLAASTFMGRALSLAQISSTFIKHLLSNSCWRLGNLVCFCHTVASECFSDGLA